jgi:hypothetical protein
MSTVPPASSGPRKRLPSRPSAEHLRKQAKRLARESNVALAEAQHRLARSYGARTWAELMHMVATMLRGADRLEGVEPGFEALPAAANAGDLERVRAILDRGEHTQHDLDLALARAVLRFAERAPIARLLVAHGADPDGQYGADYGPIVLVTGESLDPDGLAFLIEAGCDVTFAPVPTKYGPQCALSAWLGSYVRGRGDAKRRGIDLLLRHGAHVPAEVTPPLLAIHRDDAAALGRELDRDPALIQRVFDALPYAELPGGTLLHYAAELGAAACLRLLVDRGAAINLRSRTGLTPIACAARGSGPDEVRLLLDRGAHVFVDDGAGRSPCAHARAATANPHREANTRLLSEISFGDDHFAEAVALIDRGDVEALTALLAAHPHLVTQRLESDSAITRGYFSRPTLLHFVARNPSDLPHMPPRIVESTRAILDAGAEVDATTGHVMGGTTLALVASSGPGHTDGLVRPLVELLVSRGADPSVGLRAAILHRFVETTRLLHALGAAPTAVSAAGVGDLDALRAVLAAGIDDSERLFAGWAAAMNGEGGAIDLLVADGLDVNTRLPRPFAPVMLHEAAWNNQRAACERLRAHGADLTIRDTQYDSTPAGWARYAGHAELADYLEPPG